MITIVTKWYCPFCSRAKEFLDNIGRDYQEIEVSNDPETYLHYQEISGMKTVPQIFYGEIKKENLIGWYDDMMAKFTAWELFTQNT